MKEIIKRYLEETLKKDKALLLSYNPVKIDDCVNYITKMAKEHLHGKNGAIPDDEVFHWAREYFVDGICKKEVQNKFETKLSSMSVSAKQKKLESLKKLQSEFDF